MMRNLRKLLVLFVGLSLCTGCASVQAIKEPTVRAYDKMLVFLHIRKTPEETAVKIPEADVVPESEVQPPPQVCLLDPTTMIPQHSEPSPVGSGEAPVAEVSEMVHDFGNLKQDGEYVHQFKVKNAGNAMLDIKKVVPG